MYRYKHLFSPQIACPIKCNQSYWIVRSDDIFLLGNNKFINWTSEFIDQFSYICRAVISVPVCIDRDSVEGSIKTGIDSMTDLNALCGDALMVLFRLVSTYVIAMCRWNVGLFRLKKETTGSALGFPFVFLNIIVVILLTTLQVILLTNPSARFRRFIVQINTFLFQTNVTN